MKRKNTTFAVPSASNANKSRVLFESVEKPSNLFYSTLEDVPILGDPGADSGTRKSPNGRKNIWHEEK